MALKPRRRIQSRQHPSTMPSSKSGPRKRMAVKDKDLIVSSRPTGKYPSWCRDESSGSSAANVRMMKVDAVHRKQERETALMRPRITEGASRERVGDGRVVGDT